MRLFVILSSLCTVLLLGCNDSTESNGASTTIKDTVLNSEDSVELIKPIDYLYVTNEEEATAHIDSLFRNYSIENRSEYPFDSLNTKPSLLILRHQNLDTLQFYITYFFLKRYRYDLKIGHMSYEIRNYSLLSPKDYIMGVDSLADPLLYEFFRFYNPFEKDGISLDALMKKPVERISSHIVLDWIEENPQYKSYPLISDELDSIQSVKEWINTLEYP